MKLSLLELVTDWREYADAVRPIASGAFNEDELMRLARSNVYRHCANRLEAALAQQAQPEPEDALTDDDRDIIAITDRIDFDSIKKRLLDSKPKKYGIPLREALGYMWAHAKDDKAMPKQYVEIVGDLFSDSQ